MIKFECAECKTLLERLDSQAGKYTTCSKCFCVMPIPGTPSPEGPEEYDTVETSSKDAEKSSPAPKSRIHPMVFVISTAIGAVSLCTCVLLTIPAIQKVREAAARSISINNLKAIALGFHAFHQANKQIPFNGGESGDPFPHSSIALGGVSKSGSWGFQILPFVNQQSIFQAADRTKPVPIYLCPGRGRPQLESSKSGGAWTDFFFNNYLNDPDQASNPAAKNGRHHFGHIQMGDGVAYTVLIGHGNVCISQYGLDSGVARSGTVFVGGTANTMRAGNNGIVNPAGIFFSRDSTELPNIGSWGGPFAGGALMAMCDASVRNFPYAMNNFGAFLTPSGQEKVSVPD